MSNAYETLKRQVEQLQRDVDRASGAIDAVKTEIRETFDCESLGQLEKRIKKKTAELENLDEAFQAAKEKFEKKYVDVLETLGEC